MPKESFPIETETDALDVQLNARQEIEVAGGTAEVTDITPEKLKDEVPVFFAPAWACTTEVYKPALKTLAEQERRVITLDHPRRGGDMSAAPEEAVQKYPKEEVRKALNILGVLEEKNVEKTDVIAHSEGAVNALIAASLYPEKFRNIVLFGPAGLIGEDTFTRLFQGFLGQNKRAESLKAHEGEESSWEEIPVTEREKQVGAKAASEAVKYLAKNPMRALSEARGMAKTQVHDLLKYLSEKGIGVVVMSGVDDPVFPQERIQGMVKAGEIKGYLSLRGGHGAIGEHPEYMKAAEQMLSTMRDNSEKEEGE